MIIHARIKDAEGNEIMHREFNSQNSTLESILKSIEFYIMAEGLNKAPSEHSISKNFEKLPCKSYGELTINVRYDNQNVDSLF